MKFRFLQTLLTICVMLSLSSYAYAQPANDDCANAIAITLADDEASCVLVEGNTLGGTPSADPASVCSGTWFADDIWFTFDTGDDIPSGGIFVKAFFGDNNADVPAVGMAIYSGCGASDTPIACFSSADPAQNQHLLFPNVLSANTSYYVRVWSGGSATDESGSLRICAFAGEPDNAIVIWNDEFDGGMGDWTTEDQLFPDSTFFWTHTTVGAQGALLGSGSTLSSPTSSNGYMIFDADLYTTMGDPNTPVPGPPYPPYESALISPIIDCSSCPPTSVRFYQNYLALNGDTYMDWSIDGGNTWIGRINVNEDIEANVGTLSPSVKRFFIPDFAGQDSARIRFVFDGDFYFWMIDDVQVIETERNNLRVMDNWWAIPTNRITPNGQVEEFGFVADIYNAGSAPQPNTRLTVTVEEATNTVSPFTATFDYGNIGADSLAENEIFTETYTPQAGLTTDYTITYTVSSDSTDFDLSDNSLSHTYSTSDTVFAKETGRTRSLRPADALWADGAPHSWSIGSYYYIIDGDDQYVTSASIGLTNPQDHAGKILSVLLYKFSDANQDQLIQPTEREPVGANTYEITGNEAPQSIITIPVTDLNSTDPVPTPLDDNSEYVLMVQYVTDQDDDNLFVEASEEYDYSAGVWLTEQVGNPRYTHVLHIGGEEDYRLVPSADIGTTNFGHDIVPLIRMNISSEVISTDELPADNLVEVYPNPASELLNVDIDLVNTSENVEVKLINITGKVIDLRLYSDLQTERTSFDVRDYPAGGYFLHILTDEGQRSQYFVIQR